MLFCSCSSWVIQSYFFALFVELVDQGFVIFTKLVLIDVDYFIVLERFFGLEFGIVMALLIFILQLDFDLLVVEWFRLLIHIHVRDRSALSEHASHFSCFANSSNLHRVLYLLHFSILLLVLLQSECSADFDDFWNNSVFGVCLLFFGCVADILFLKKFL